MEFYTGRLGFEVTFSSPATDPFFATVRRDGVQILLKVVNDNVGPQPNRTRHIYARWDAFITVPDPDSLATELEDRGLTFSAPR